MNILLGFERAISTPLSTQAFILKAQREFKILSDRMLNT